MPYDRYGDYIREPRPVPKCKWKVGDHVYLVNRQKTSDYFCEIPGSLLGKRFIVQELQSSGYGSFAKVSVKQYRADLRMSVHPADLSATNTYVDPKKGLPKYYREISDMALSSYSRSYRCHWLIYKDKPDGWWKKLTPAKAYADLSKALTHGKSPCRSCWRVEDSREEACKECEKKKVYEKEKIYADPAGWNNTNTACFAQFSGNVENMKGQFNVTPDRMMVKLDWEYVDVPLSDPNLLDWEDVCNYFKYMVKGKCLPDYIEKPTMKDHGKSIHVTLKIGDIGVNRLFWYLNVLRNVCEYAGLVKLTCHFVEKGKMEPLMAYAMAHIALPGFNGGHSCLEDCSWGRAESSCYDPTPDMKEVIRYVVRVHRLLTQDVETPLSKATSYRWQLHAKSMNQKGVSLEGLRNLENKPFKESSTFDPETNTFKEK